MIWRRKPQRLATVVQLCAVVLLSVACSLPFAWAEEATPSDVAGWQKTRWGMSPTELRSIFGNRLSAEQLTVKPPDANREILKLSNYLLFGKKFEVRFFWDDLNKLSRVSIVTDTKFDSTLCNKLEGSLLSKYGRGQILEQKKIDRAPMKLGNDVVWSIGIDQKKIRWIFPSTIITYQCSLTDIGPDSLPANIVYITYEPNEAGKL